MSADNIAALTLIFVVIVRSPSQNNVLHIGFNFEDTDTDTDTDTDALAYAFIYMYSHRIKMSD
jgi:hypothetical protein